MGDFDEDLVKKLLILYVGTIPRLSPLSSTETPAKVAKREGGFSLKMSGVAKRVDTSVLEEISRACVMLTFPTFNRSVSRHFDPYAPSLQHPLSKTQSPKPNHPKS